MKRFRALFCCLLLSAFCLPPSAFCRPPFAFRLPPWLPQQGAPPPPDKGRAILEAAIQALGGGAFLKARDFRAEGRAFQFGREEELSGMARFVEYEKFPDKLRQELGKDKDVIVILNGDKGWDKDFHGVREYPEEEMRRIRENRLLSVEHVLRFRLNEPGLTVRFLNSDVFAGHPVNWVEVVDAENHAVSIAVEQESKLPVRREWSRRNPQTHVRENEVEVMGNYQNIGGILTPLYSLRERNGNKIFEVFITGGAYNLNLADSLFARPPGPERPDPRRKKQKAEGSKQQAVGSRH